MTGNTPHDVTAFTLEDMHRFAREAWGMFGNALVERWAEFNRRYFEGVLRPVPLVLTHTQPFGKRLAFCSYAPTERMIPHGRTITLNVPKSYRRLLADNNTLLHEMIHQHLFERGEAPGHESEGWRREIMRLHKQITGADIWAGRSKTVRRKDGNGGSSFVVRINVPHPITGEASLTQGQIARWPHEPIGVITLGSLGAPSNTLQQVTADAA
jgi:hypothetical protein